jgi:hypothetical protein
VPSSISAMVLPDRQQTGTAAGIDERPDISYLRYLT